MTSVVYLENYIESESQIQARTSCMQAPWTHCLEVALAYPYMHDAACSGMRLHSWQKNS